MTKFVSLVALSALMSACAYAQRLPAPESHVLITAQQPATPFEDSTGASVIVVKGGELRAALTQDGDLQFGQAATVDFADIVQTHGRLVGYAIVRVQGQKMVMPVYEYVDEAQR
jgi:hypothetical protein